MHTPIGEGKYWAFLSYSHADEAAAARLHRALEGYRLPAAVCKAHALPKRLIPVFRDVEELEAAAGLTTRLREAIDQSRWMVVLCSPAAARSKYVNDEVDYFLKCHGADRLLCVLADGEPPGCFPPAIRALADEPLAADLRRGAPFDIAVLKLIAAMAMVGFTELRNREAQRRRRQRLALAAGIAGIAIGALGAWDLLYREHIDDYAGYVRRNGIWQGVDRLDGDAAAHRILSFRFVRHGRLRPPERVDFLGACGTFEKLGVPDILGNAAAGDDTSSEAFCSATFVYHGDGSISSETLHNKLGVPRETLTYTGADLAQFTEEGFASSRSRSGIYYVQFGRDPEGRDIAIRFLQSRDAPRPNNRHDFGYAFAYDDAGRVARKGVLDDRGVDVGEATLYRYDDRGFLLEERSVDARGQPRLDERGIASVQYTPDARGNRVRERYRDAAGQPAFDSDGIAERDFRIDANGNVAEVRFFDTQGRPAVAPDGISGYRQQFDPRGFRTRYEAIDGQGNLVGDREGIAYYLLVNDEHGNNLENSVFDAEGHPAVWGSGVHDDRKKFDARGNKIEEAFFGIDGKPVVTRYWGARFVTLYDGRGNFLGARFYDADGRPYVRPDMGSAAVTREYDDKGNEVGDAHLGPDLQPVLSVWGWASSRLAYDNLGNLVERQYLGRDRRPVMTTEGFAIQRFGHDAAGNEIRMRYLGPDGRPVPIDNGAFGWNAEYDRRGRMARRTYVDASGQPMPVHGGYVTVAYERNAVGDVTQESYLDSRGRLVPPPRAARTVMEYDDRHRETARRCEDSAGKPANGPHDYATLRTELDRYGRVLSERAFDARGRPVNIREQGWAVHTVSYAGASVDAYLDAAGKTVRPRRYRQ